VGNDCLEDLEKDGRLKVKFVLGRLTVDGTVLRMLPSDGF
jgi:hypothetical protein